MEAQLVYSTSIKDNRYTIQCIAAFDKIRVVKFIVDTGAKCTCCTYKTLGVFQILLTNKKTNIQPLFVLKYNCNNNPTGGDCMFLKIYFISILKGCK